MKKLIKKNPIKAQKISLVLFVSLMVLSGFFGALLANLLVWFITVAVAVWQVIYITKWAQYYITDEKNEQMRQAQEKLKDMLGGANFENMQN